MQSKTALILLVAFFATVCTGLVAYAIGFELCSDRPDLSNPGLVVVASMAIAAWGFLFSLRERPAPAVAEEVAEEVAPTATSSSDAWFAAYQADQARMQAAWEARMRADQERSDKWWADIQAQNARIEEEWKKRNGF